MFSDSGVKRFQKKVFETARKTISRMKEMNAQGVITWDVEGAEFPDATFMGDPTKLATADPCQSVAPEMAQIVDQYFKMYRDAGYKVDVTIRPQRLPSFIPPAPVDSPREQPCQAMLYLERARLQY